MPGGKPAGVRCVNLSEANQCTIWGTPHYPTVCHRFRPDPEVCGTTTEEALTRLAEWERLTRPG